MTFKFYTPSYPLNEMVDHLFFYKGYNPEHNLDRFLPDGNTEIVFYLMVNPKYFLSLESIK